MQSVPVLYPRKYHGDCTKKSQHTIQHKPTEVYGGLKRGEMGLPVERADEGKGGWEGLPVVLGVADEMCRSLGLPPHFCNSSLLLGQAARSIG
jgi:hypothetical protein